MRHCESSRAGYGLSAILAPGGPGTAEKNGFAGLLPGGMTLDAETGAARFLHDISPEPVIGPGGTKGYRGSRTVYRGFRIIAG